MGSSPRTSARLGLAVEVSSANVGKLAAEKLQIVGVPGVQQYQPPVAAPVAQLELQPRLRQGGRGWRRATPRTRSRRRRRRRRAARPPRRRGPSEAVGVHVRHLRRPPPVPLGDRERRAGDRPLHAEGPRHGPHQRGLPGAELAAQQHQVAGPQEVGQQAAEGRRRRGAVALPGEGGGQNSPSCSSAAAAPAGAAGARWRGGGTATAGGAAGARRRRGRRGRRPSSSGMRAKSASRVDEHRPRVERRGRVEERVEQQPVPADLDRQLVAVHPA